MSDTREPTCAGILLTGGASRRMGVEKASLVVNGVALARHVAAVLSVVAAPVVEVGPGLSGLESVLEEPRGSGPLVALTAGVRALRARGHRGAALVLACDLPLMTPEALAMLVEWPTENSVVPLVDGEPQILCARWSGADLEAALELVSGGVRAVRALLDRPGIVFVPEAEFRTGVTPVAFADVDTPDDLARLGLRSEQEQS